MSELKRALDATNISIKKYDPTKARPIYTNKSAVGVSKFTEELVAALGVNLLKHPAVVAAINNDANMTALIEEYVDSNGVSSGTTGASQIVIPPELAHLTLNIDRTSKEAGAKRFFCTTPEELVDPGTSGQYFLDSCGASIPDGVRMSRAVVPRYMPRRAKGIHQDTNEITGTSHDCYNTYIPPEWELWKRRNPAEWAALPAKPPEMVMRFLKHLIPDELERKYLYAWIYTSMTSRSFVYLVLQGSPGVGKNRLKILLRALHGKLNSVDGKKETFGANDNKFNSQMLDNTMMWLDELKYGPEMEPRMKEYQNPNIAIERKGVDATSSSEIYSSMVISNNYPRDNYILFNSRKFAPLVLGEAPLTCAMTPEEIAEMSDKLDNTTHAFDVTYAAQIAKWILKVGPKHVAKWPNLEYQGPKFWELAHTSMSRWQKIAVVALTTQNRMGKFPGWDQTKGAFLWSKVEEALRRKKEYESKDYRDASTVKAFFDTYCDDQGQRVFETENIPGSIIQDFWVKTKVMKVVQMARSLNSPKVKTEDTNKLKRPAGVTDFMWRKMKAEHEAIQKGGVSGLEEEILDL